MRWGWLFARSCTPDHTARAAPVLRDLCLSGRELFLELADLTGNAFELKKEGLLNLCKTQEGLDHEAHGLAKLANELGVEAQVLDWILAGAAIYVCGNLKGMATDVDAELTRILGRDVLDAMIADGRYRREVY